MAISCKGQMGVPARASGRRSRGKRLSLRSERRRPREQLAAQPMKKKMIMEDRGLTLNR